MKKKELKIGLALSGGGMRAAVFHLGVLKCLAKRGLLSKVTHISSVSGASICIGLVYGCNQNHWPTNRQFLTSVLPAIKQDITEKDIQWTSLLKLLVRPYYWDKKPNLLANVMQKKWKVPGCLQDIPKYPLWTINTTAYETGKDFRISNEQMGDWQSGYVEQPRFSLTHAMAASAGFPVLIGPYKLKTDKYTWHNYRGEIIEPRDQILHLWDGGVYDNMGLDPLFHIGDTTELARDINYLIVSNAAGHIEHKTRQFSYSIENLKRMLDISMDQVESLKSRNVLGYFRKNHNGIYVKIGRTVMDVLHHCDDIPYEAKERYMQQAMPMDQVKKVADYKTTLECMSDKDFEMIMQHGYEVCETMLLCHGHIEG